jgi:hypothetical protein
MMLRNLKNKNNSLEEDLKRKTLGKYPKWSQNTRLTL